MISSSSTNLQRYSWLRFTSLRWTRENVKRMIIVHIETKCPRQVKPCNVPQENNFIWTRFSENTKQTLFIAKHTSWDVFSANKEDCICTGSMANELVFKEESDSIYINGQGMNTSPFQKMLYLECQALIVGTCIHRSCLCMCSVSYEIRVSTKEGMFYTSREDTLNSLRYGITIPNPVCSLSHNRTTYNNNTL